MLKCTLFYLLLSVGFAAGHCKQKRQRGRWIAAIFYCWSLSVFVSSRARSGRLPKCNQFFFANRQTGLKRSLHLW